MNTYRRFTCVNRSIQFFLNQDTQADTELIIYNTDVENPMTLSNELSDKNIRVVNNNTDYVTNNPYTNIGDIRRDSLDSATGDYYICWDDDDIFMPWHIRQCIDGFSKNPDIWAWKPHTSMWWQIGQKPALACNNMEASIIVRLDKLREYNFTSHLGGGEHLRWMSEFKNVNKLYTDIDSVPSYCFNWHDSDTKVRGHKQSGSINRVDNFNFHKKHTTDFATGPLSGCANINDIYDQHIQLIKNNIEIKQPNNYIISTYNYEKYCKQYDKYDE